MIITTHLQKIGKRLDYLVLTDERESLPDSARISQVTICGTLPALKDNISVFVTLKNQIAEVDGIDKQEPVDRINRYMNKLG